MRLTESGGWSQSAAAPRSAGSIRRFIGNQWRETLRSPFLPFEGIVLIQLMFGFGDTVTISNHYLHLLRTIPLNSVFQTAVFLWIYHRQLSLRTMLAHNARRGALVGLALAPIVLFFSSAEVEYFNMASHLCRLIQSWLPGISQDEIFAAAYLPLKAAPLWMLSRVPGYGPVELIGEELFFRGVVFNLILARRGSVPKAVLWSSFFFALAHGQMLMLPYYFLWGCAAATAYAWTRSIWTPITIHILYNFVATFLIPQLASIFRGLR